MDVQAPDTSRDDLSGQVIEGHVGQGCIRVCVPRGWEDARVARFADRVYPSGTEHGWRVTDYTRQECEFLKSHCHVRLER